MSPPHSPAGLVDDAHPAGAIGSITAAPNLMTAAAPRKAAARMVGIDAGRYVGIYAIIVVHVLVRRDQAFTIEPDDFVVLLCRFAAPFFFMSAGFFLAQRPGMALLPDVIRIVRRLLPVFLIWCAIYAVLMPHGVPDHFDLRAVIVLLATGGAGYHLWFLASLIVCSVMTLVLTRLCSFTVAVTVAALLYGVGLLVGSYAGLLVPSAAGSAMQLSIARGGPFFGTIFMVLGAWLARSGWRPGIAVSVAVLIAGGLCQLGEAYWLDYFHLSRLRENDFLLGTLAFGAGSFLLALQMPSGSRLAGLCARLGRFTLGIYAVHLLIVTALRFVAPPLGLAGKLAEAVLVLAVSTGIAWTLSRWRGTRFLAY